MAKKWIQQALKGHRKGSLSRQLDILEKKNIPPRLLEQIKKADIGDTVVNRGKIGKRAIKVTRLLKKRAVLASTLKTINK